MERYRMRWNILTVWLALAAIPLWPNVAARAAPMAPGAFVKSLTGEVIAIFNDPRLSPAQQEERLYGITVRDFDVQYTARFTLGSYWRTASEKEQTEYTEVFKHYIVHIYAGQFRVYHDVDVKVLQERPESPTISLVRTELVRRDGRPPINVDWHIVTRGGVNKIIDVSVDGVSQLLTLREEFMSTIARNQGGVPMLTSKLVEKTRL